MKRVVRSLRSLTPRGFTLPEVLVTVAIIAVLASAVVPTVVNQLGKGDTPALQADLNSIRQAITNFTSDVRVYPATMGVLNDTTGIPSTTAGLCSGTTYGTNYYPNWKGPYLQSKQKVSSTSHFLTTTYSLRIEDGLTIPTGSGQIAVQVKTAAGAFLTGPEASTLKTALDGAAADTTPGSYNGGSGLVRFSQSGSFGTSPVYILLVPVGSC